MGVAKIRERAKEERKPGESISMFQRYPAPPVLIFTLITCKAGLQGTLKISKTSGAQVRWFRIQKQVMMVMVRMVRLDDNFADGGE
jgi:hypothetical protein